MFKKFIFSVIFVLWPITGHSESLSQIYVNDLKWPPFFFPELENNQTGFGRDILNTCLKKMHYKPKLITLPLKRIHMYVQSGEIDLTVFSYKKNRENFLYYAKEPLFTSQYGFASKKSDQIEIKTLNDINHYTLGHLAGLGHTPEIIKIIKNKKVKKEVSTSYDLDSMYGQLLSNPQRFQIMINSKETLIWRAKELNVLDKIKVHDIVVKEKHYYVTVSKKSKNIINPQLFLDEMDSCIIDLKHNGIYKKIASSYNL